MTDVTLNATSRTEFGKDAARRIRRANQTPAVIYGHGTEPAHITVPGHETMPAVATQQLQLEVAATDISRNVEVSVQGLRAGSQIHARDIALPAGATLAADPEAELGIEHEASDEDKAAEAEAGSDGAKDDDAE